MNQKKIGKRIASWFLCLAMVLTTVNLPAFTTVVKAAETLKITQFDSSINGAWGESGNLTVGWNAVDNVESYYVTLKEGQKSGSFIQVYSKPVDKTATKIVIPDSIFSEAAESIPEDGKREISFKLIIKAEDSHGVTIAETTRDFSRSYCDIGNPTVTLTSNGMLNINAAANTSAIIIKLYEKQPSGDKEIKTFERFFALASDATVDLREYVEGGYNYYVTCKAISTATESPSMYSYYRDSELVKSSVVTMEGEHGNDVTIAMPEIRAGYTIEEVLNQVIKSRVGITRNPANALEVTISHATGSGIFVTDEYDNWSKKAGDEGSYTLSTVLEHYQTYYVFVKMTKDPSVVVKTNLENLFFNSQDNTSGWQLTNEDTYVAIGEYYELSNYEKEIDTVRLSVENPQLGEIPSSDVVVENDIENYLQNINVSWEDSSTGSTVTDFTCNGYYRVRITVEPKAGYYFTTESTNLDATINGDIETKVVSGNLEMTKTFVVSHKATEEFKGKDENYHWKVCEVCGAKYGANYDHNFETVIDREPTKDMAGLGHDVCKDCGYITNVDKPVYIEIKNVNITIKDLIPGETYINNLKSTSTVDNENVSIFGTAIGDETGVDLMSSYKYECEHRYMVTFGLKAKENCTFAATKDLDITINGKKAELSYEGSVLMASVLYETAHDFTNQPYEDAKDGIHHNQTCKVCGAIVQENHDFSEQPYQVDEDGKHYQKCKDCGAESTHEAHTGGTATCTKKAVCEVCGEEYGELAAHSYSSEWKSDKTNHWHECTVCKDKKDNAAHADSDKNEKCDTCDYNMHSHSGTKVAQVDATCTSYGVKAYYKCSCGKYYSDSACTKEITDLAVWKSGDGRIDKKPHTGGTATCKEKAKCTVCGEEYGSLATHTYDTKWSSDGTNHWYACTVCGAKKDSAAHTLKTTTTKATLTANGKKETKCTVCGKVTKTETIYAAKTIKLSATKYTYDGKVKKPSVTIKDSNGNAIASTNYTVTYPSGRKNVGKYTVKVTFKGNYSGSKNLTFTINPPKTSISKLTAGKKAFTVKWAKKTTQVTGYEIQYSTSSTFAKGNKTVKVTSSKTVSKTISKLTGGKKYYVRIRTYKTVGKTPYYSDWSAKKSVTTKK